MPLKKENFGLTNSELSLLKSLSTPKKIQDYLNSLKINFEEEGDTCMSPRQVIKTKKAHCIEGAILAAAAFRLNNIPPLILDFEASENDFDHVIAVFKKNNHWGAVSKTNHSSLRYREPIYKTIRELAMSFFHEYFLNESGKKTLRAFSNPVDLSIFDKYNWMSSDEEVWFISEYLTKIPHHKILNKSQIANLRPADKIEIEAGKLADYKLAD